MNAVVEVGGQHAVVASINAAMAATKPTQYLTFMLGSEVIAIGILHVKEIIEYHSITPVSMMMACICGVINLRGAVVPVMDMLARFGRSASAVTKRSCIVIVEIAAEQGRQVVGVVVDAVNEVIDILPADIEPAPSFGTRIRGDFIAGMGKVRGKFVILLDVERVLTLDDIGVVTEAAAPVATH